MPRLGIRTRRAQALREATRESVVGLVTRCDRCGTVLGDGTAREVRWPDGRVGYYCEACYWQFCDEYRVKR